MLQVVTKVRLSDGTTVNFKMERADGGEWRSVGAIPEGSTILGLNVVMPSPDQPTVTLTHGEDAQ